MKFVSFRAEGTDRYGVVIDEAVVDLSARQDDYPTLRTAIAGRALSRLGESAIGASPDFALNDIVFQLPIPQPSKILCVGVNYANRAEEYASRIKESQYPNIFLRTAQSFTGHKQPLIRPVQSDQLDYEGEIALIIGQPGRMIERDTALAHVAGLTVANEGTIRDWTKHGARNSAGGKNFDASGSIGPWMETEALKTKAPLSIKTRVNDELRQDDSTANIIYPFDLIISYISQFTELLPGDIILTGTPTGAGTRFDPPRYLKPDDILCIEVSGVGTLINPVHEPGRKIHN
ncbi:fumarylacetoacetate hydrolase family protein [Phyllobacterium sp. SB3]|uniref:fumarylacetoacetate hydrolase family protein n=1 Tax=Phyllobacterium sp. SB3 TaxID=3156073 RepID=UPI0032AF04DB